MTKFETIDDAAMEQVKGGLGFSLGFDLSNSGLTVDGPLGSLSVPNPFTVVTDGFRTLTGKLGDLISKLGGKLTDVGHLFDFS